MQVLAIAVLLIWTLARLGQIELSSDCLLSSSPHPPPGLMQATVHSPQQTKLYPKTRLRTRFEIWTKKAKKSDAYNAFTNFFFNKPNNKPNKINKPNKSNAMDDNHTKIDSSSPSKANNSKVKKVKQANSSESNTLNLVDLNIDLLQNGSTNWWQETSTSTKWTIGITGTLVVIGIVGGSVAWYLWPSPTIASVSPPSQSTQNTSQPSIPLSPLHRSILVIVNEQYTLIMVVFTLINGTTVLVCIVRIDRIIAIRQQGLAPCAVQNYY